MVLIPDALAAATVLREGDAGRGWLEELPFTFAAACERWGCIPEGESWHGQVALVVPVGHRSGPGVLKVSFPHPGNIGEAEALRCFGGHGAVRLIDADDTGFVLLMERADPTTLADRLATGAELAVEEAIEIAGDLALQLAVPALPSTVALASTAQGWDGQLKEQVAAFPDLLPKAVTDRARRTIRLLATDTTSTMLHGDLHFGNILRSSRQPWLTIDPKGWSGTRAWDAFTVIAGRREQLQQGGDIYRGAVNRVQRFSTAAKVDPDLALACCQARAVSSYFYQHLVQGAWFDVEFLRVLAHGI